MRSRSHGRRQEPKSTCPRTRNGVSTRVPSPTRWQRSEVWRPNGPGSSGPERPGGESSAHSDRGGVVQARGCSRRRRPRSSGPRSACRPTIVPRVPPYVGHAPGQRTSRCSEVRMDQCHFRAWAERNDQTAADESNPMKAVPTSDWVPGKAGCPIHAWLAPVTLAHSTTVPASHGCQISKLTAELDGSTPVVGVEGPQGTSRESRAQVRGQWA